MRGFLFIALIVGVLSISLVSAAASCDVAVSRTTVLPVDFTDQQKTARTLVFGEATGTFSETIPPTVTIDCNVNNVEPKPLEKTVKARVTYSATSLSYRGDCYYSRPKLDTKYTVGSTLLPDNVQCVRSVDSGTITTPGSGEEDKKTTPVECGTVGIKVCEIGEKCKTPAVPDGYGKCTTCPAGTTPQDGKCVSVDIKKTCPEGQTLVNGRCVSKGGEDTSGLVCLDGSKPINGECPQKKKCPEGTITDSFTGQCYEDPKQNRPVTCAEGKVYDKITKECVVIKKGESENDLPKLPEEEDTFTITLKNKYTFIGIPFEDAELVSNSCERIAMYTHDSEKNNFVKETLDSFSNYFGKGLLAKIPSGTECKLVFKGSFSEEQSFDLKKGWSLISPQTRAFENAKNRKSDCTFLSPFVRLDGKYAKEQTMKPGTGYLIKVKSDCTLSTKDALGLPRLPEEDAPPSQKSNTQTIEPQKGKSRKFAGDAG